MPAPSTPASAPLRGLHSLRTVLEMIKIEHTVFALPFALLGTLLAAGGWPPWRTVFWIVVAMDPPYRPGGRGIGTTGAERKE